MNDSTVEITTKLSRLAHRRLTAKHPKHRTTESSSSLRRERVSPSAQAPQPWLQWNRSKWMFRAISISFPPINKARHPATVPSLHHRDPWKRSKIQQHRFSPPPQDLNSLQSPYSACVKLQCICTKICSVRVFFYFESDVHTKPSVVNEKVGGEARHLIAALGCRERSLTPHCRCAPSTCRPP